MAQAATPAATATSFWPAAMTLAAPVKPGTALPVVVVLPGVLVTAPVAVGAGMELLPSGYGVMAAGVVMAAADEVIIMAELLMALETPVLSGDGTVLMGAVGKPVWDAQLKMSM